MGVQRENSSGVMLEAMQAPAFFSWHLDTTKAFEQLSLKVLGT